MGWDGMGISRRLCDMYCMVDADIYTGRSSAAGGRREWVVACMQLGQRTGRRKEEEEEEEEEGCEITAQSQSTCARRRRP